MSIESDYVALHPKSAALHARAAVVLPSGVTHDSRHLRPFLIAVDHAAGARKWDVDGYEYVDYVMGHGALLLGHNHPAVQEAVATQLAKGTHYGGNHILEVEWAEAVCRIVPSAEVVRFTSSGTEATLMALRLARAATGKPGVLKFDRHFHGWHDYLIAGSRYAGAAVPPGVPEGTLDSVAVVPPEMDAVAATIAARDDIGAIIVEPAGASSGAIPLPPGFIRDLRTFTAERGIVFIMDEVVTGFRWAPGGVQALEGVVPDLTTLAKILAGGLPGGAVAGRRNLMTRLAFPPAGAKAAKVGHPGTFNANPLSAAAGVACLALARTGEHQTRASALAAQLRAGLNSVLCRMGIPGVAYGVASDLHLIVGAGGVPEAADYAPQSLDPGLLASGTEPELARQLQLALLNRGVHFFGASGFVSSVHTEADIAATLDAWEAGLSRVRVEGLL
ncbi:MAG: aspartate aminotransferase family protein [Dehalococcoidia bacterium]